MATDPYSGLDFGSIYHTDASLSPWMGVDFSGKTSLPGTPTVPNTGSLPNVSSTGIPGGGGGAGGNTANLVKSFAPLLLSLFGSNPYTGQASQGANKLTDLSASLEATGKSLTGQGQDALGPVLQYFKALAGGDRASLLNATAPDRARILDQYDTARRSMTNTPRGGGQAGASGKLEAAQASDLVTSLSSARATGAHELAGLGANLVGQGVQATQGAATTLDEAVNQFQRLSTSKNATNNDLGSAIGAMIPFLLAAAA